MFAQEDFVALAELRASQQQPCEGDIRLCGGCLEDPTIKAESRGAIGDGVVRTEVSIMYITVKDGEDSYRVVSSMDGDWTKGTKSGGVRWAGSFSTSRPNLDADGNPTPDQRTEDGVNTDYANRLKGLAREVAKTCSGVNEYGNCPAVQVVAEAFNGNLLTIMRRASQPTDPTA